MGSTTTKGYPFPVGTDRVMDGDDAIKALAEKVDTQLGSTASGATNVTTTAADVAATTAVTFPVGRFAVPPVIVCQWAASMGNNASQYQINWPSAVTAAGFTMNVRRWGAATTTVNWHATVVDR